MEQTFDPPPWGVQLTGTVDGTVHLACIVEQVFDAAVLSGSVSLADKSELVPDILVLPDTVGLTDAADH